MAEREKDCFLIPCPCPLPGFVLLTFVRQIPSVCEGRVMGKIGPVLCQKCAMKAEEATVTGCKRINSKAGAQQAGGGNRLSTTDTGGQMISGLVYICSVSGRQYLTSHEASWYAKLTQVFRVNLNHKTEFIMDQSFISCY